MGGRITHVKSGGLAERLGVRPGDVLVSINSTVVRDVLDVMYSCADAGAIEMELVRGGQRVCVRGTGDGDLGLEFEALTFDGMRRCRNRCRFCFVDQLPQGMRSTLYVKDDDYRYSVLCGNFVTLTNLSDDDWERLREQRLGPLRVSVHTTDLGLRRWMLGNPQAPDVLEQLGRLGELRIPVHCQIVLVPGVNDGRHLERTILDLAALHPTVQSMAVVPVGHTRHGAFGVSEQPEFTVAECRALVDRAGWWQREFRAKLGCGLVYLADEFYLRAERRVPSARSYDGFPQYENGVGMVRALLDDWRRVRSRVGHKAASGSRRATVGCGTAIASVLGEIVSELAEIGGPKVDLVPVENAFFGPTVTVSGLLTGGDVVRALEGQDLGDVVVLPRAMLDRPGELTLDDESPASLEARLKRPVRFAATISELLRLM